MLKHFRNRKTQKRIWIVLAILILPAFVFWGTGSVMRSQRMQSFSGKIGGKKVSSLDFQNALRATRNRALIVLGDNYFKMEKDMDLASQAWDRLLLKHEAELKKIKVSDKEIAETLESYPFFQKDGSFDLLTYERLLKYMFGTPPRTFEEDVRDDIKIRKLYEMITFSEELTEEQIKNEYKRENEEARVDYLSGSPADFATSLTIEDKEVEAFFKNNPVAFKKPESFNLQYIEIAYPQETKDAYNQAIDDRAKEIYTGLRRQKDLAKVAKAFSLEAKETGFFTIDNPIPDIGWSPEIISAIIKLENNQLSTPIHTAKGWYLIKLKQRKEPYIPAFEEVKTQVREKLIGAKSRDMAREKIKAASAKLKDMYQLNPQAIDFQKLAKEFGLKAGETEFFKRASYIPNIGISDLFFNGVANLKVGEITPVLDSKQAFYIARLKERKNIDEERFLKEKAEFKKKLISMKKDQTFAEFLQRLRQAANLEIDFSKSRSLDQYK